MKYIVEDPNFSIIMPGGCNASCGFCFYKFNPNRELYGTRWFKSLMDSINILPKQFTQCSITGGEPSLNSPRLYTTLKLIRKRFNKIVLTTNSTGMRINNSSYIKKILSGRLVDYINISRHHYQEDENFGIFNSRSVMNTSELRQFIKESHQFGIPVTINCVITPTLNIERMIDYCSKIKAYAIRFREQSEIVPKKQLSTDEVLSYSKEIYKESSGYV